MIKLGIVLINYHCVDEVVNYIEEELSKSKIEKKIVIVNNSSVNNNSTQELSIRLSGIIVDSEKKYTDQDNVVYILDPLQNLGYAKANNIGAQFLISNFDTKYILFSNSDIEIQSYDVIEYLIFRMGKDNNVAMANPCIKDEGGRFQAPGKYISLTKRYILRFLLFPIFFNKLKKGLWSDIIENAPEGFYYRLSGCFLLVNAQRFYDVGMFDTNTFLFGEELILAKRMESKGYKSAYYPDKIILHKENQVISNHFSKLNRTKLMFKSDYYYYKHYTNTSAFALLIGKISWVIFSRIYYPIFKIIRK